MKDHGQSQMHRLEMQLCLLDESGKQLAMPSHHFGPAAAAHDQSFKLETKLNAVIWKATRRLRIVVNWVN